MRYYSSIATAKSLSTNINNSATQITLSGLPEGLTSYPYTLVIDPDLATEEIVTVTSLSSGTTLNVTRGQDGSTAASHSSGAIVKHMVTARDLQEPQTHMDSTTSVHGISNTANLATVAGSQTLTNKTIAASSNTITGLVSQTNGTVTTASTGSAVVRNIHVSTSDPTGGSDGDVWLKYV